MHKMHVQMHKEEAKWCDYDCTWRIPNGLRPFSLMSIIQLKLVPYWLYTLATAHEYNFI